MTTLDQDTFVTAAANVHSRALGTELVLLDFARGEYFALDEIGTALWRRIEVGVSVREMVRSVVEAYDVTEDDASRDILQLVGALNVRSLVVLQFHDRLEVG